MKKSRPHFIRGKYNTICTYGPSARTDDDDGLRPGAVARWVEERVQASNRLRDIHGGGIVVVVPLLLFIVVLESQLKVGGVRLDVLIGLGAGQNQRGIRRQLEQHLNVVHRLLVDGGIGSGLGGSLGGQRGEGGGFLVGGPGSGERRIMKWRQTPYRIACHGA